MTLAFIELTGSRTGEPVWVAVRHITMFHATFSSGLAVGTTIYLTDAAEGVEVREPVGEVKRMMEKLRK